MRFFCRSRWIPIVVVVGTAMFSALTAQPVSAQPPTALPDFATPQAEDPGSQAPEAIGGGGSPAPGGEGAGMAGSGDTPPLTFTLLAGDGSVATYSASRFFTYQLLPGAAKPTRLTGMGGMGGSGGMGSGGMSMGGMGGMGGMAYMGGAPGVGMVAPGMAGGMEGQSSHWPVMYAMVADKSMSTDEGAERSRRAMIKVVAMIKVAGNAGGPQSAAIPGTPSEPSYAEIDSKDAGLVSRILSMPKSATQEERHNVAQLIRLDVWIEDARRALRETRDDTKAFSAVEAHLKTLLGEEYDAMLAKQRGDTERLRKRLAQLQADLERRASARDRVVEVQLGKLVLEAQGLLDAQR